MAPQTAAEPEASLNQLQEGSLLVPHLNSASKLSFKQIYINKRASEQQVLCPFPLRNLLPWGFPL